ncbi:MAG: DnaJ domain-containing protein [Paracoccaceae bacterium]
MMTPIERVSVKSQALAVLGLNSTTASESDIRLAYRARVREKHPDRCNGEAGEFLRITDAFNFLCGDADDFDPTVAPEKKMHAADNSERPISRTQRPTMDFTPKQRVRSETMSRPVSKPMVQETETVLSDGIKAACSAVLDDDGLLATHQKRAGRKYAYTVPVKLLNNVNKVAVPTGDLFDLRRMKPVVLTIPASDIRGGSYLVPTEVMETHFSGARRVEICFTADI